MVSKIFKNILFFTGTKIGYHPGLFWLNYIRPSRKDKITTKSTQVCIEGYFRSGNSFFYNLFQGWNPDCKIAHHLHSPIQIERAIKMHIPCIVMIRHPLECISSLCTVDSRLKKSLALQTYIDFYYRISRLKDNYVLASFDEMILKPHQIIHKVNTKFEKSFFYREWSEQELKELVTKISEENKENLRSPVPNESKEKLKSNYKALITREKNYEKAVMIYDSLVFNRN